MNDSSTTDIPVINDHHRSFSLPSVTSNISGELLQSDSLIEPTGIPHDISSIPAAQQSSPASLTEESQSDNNKLQPGLDTTDLPVASDEMLLTSPILDTKQVRTPLEELLAPEIANLNQSFTQGQPASELIELPVISDDELPIKSTNLALQKVKKSPMEEVLNPEVPLLNKSFSKDQPESQLIDLPVISDDELLLESPILALKKTSSPTKQVFAVGEAAQLNQSFTKDQPESHVIELPVISDDESLLDSSFSATKHAILSTDQLENIQTLASEKVQLNQSFTKCQPESHLIELPVISDDESLLKSPILATKPEPHLKEKSISGKVQLNRSFNKEIQESQLIELPVISDDESLLDSSLLATKQTPSILKGESINMQSLSDDESIQLNKSFTKEQPDIINCPANSVSVSQMPIENLPCVDVPAETHSPLQSSLRISPVADLQEQAFCPEEDKVGHLFTTL